MASCLVCNQNESEEQQKSLDDFLPNEQDRGNLRTRLEHVLDEALIHVGYLCAFCVIDLAQIENYYSLLDYFRTRYRLTCNEKTTEVLENYVDCTKKESKTPKKPAILKPEILASAILKINCCIGRSEDRTNVAELPLLGIKVEAGEVNDAGQHIKKEPELGPQVSGVIQTGHFEDELTDKDEFSDPDYDQETEEKDNDEDDWVPETETPKRRTTRSKSAPASKKNQLRCSKCGQRCMSFSAMRTHKLLHKGKKYRKPSGIRDKRKRLASHPCPICVEGFRGMANLINHMKKYHEELKPSDPCLCHSCKKQIPYCDFKQHLQTHVDEHQQTFVIDKPVKETACNRKLKRKPVRKSSNKEFICSICGAYFVSKYNLKTHEQTHENKTYPCPICGKRLTGPTYVTMHIRKCHKNMTPNDSCVCKLCKTELAYSKIEDHVKIHAEEKVVEQDYMIKESDGKPLFMCSKCGTTFKVKRSLDTHLQTHQNKAYPCFMCKQNFSATENVLNHLRRRHDVQKPGEPFTCKICQGQMLFSEIKEHITTHAEDRPVEEDPDDQDTMPDYERPYECPICKKKISLVDRLIAHLQETHKVLGCDGKFGCDRCYEVFSFAIALEAHQSMHEDDPPLAEFGLGDQLSSDQSKVLLSDSTNKNADYQESKKALKLVRGSSGPFSCHLCDRTFKSRYGYRGHMRMHAGETHKCPVCAKPTPVKSALKSHMAVHIEDKPFICQVCGKTFRLKGLLKAHLLRHEGIRQQRKEIICEECGKVFVERHCFEDHMKKHKGESAYACQTCGKSFFSRICLKAHLKTHLGLRDFECSVCGRKFTTKGNLETHMYTHSTELNFKCQTCGKAFKTPASMRLHEIRHQGRKPHKCKVCGRAFAESHHKNNHEKSVHPDGVSTIIRKRGGRKKKVQAGSDQKVAPIVGHIHAVDPIPAVAQAVAQAVNLPSAPPSAQVAEHIYNMY